MSRPIDLLAGNRVRLSRECALEELRADILRVAYIEGEFLFDQGRIRSPYYLDKYLFLTRPALLRRLTGFIAEFVPEDTDRLAAPALGAVALGTAVSLQLGLPLVIVKTEGETAPPVEGELYEGERVTLIEDVIATGSRALRAIESLSAAGGHVQCVVSVVDRCEGANSRLSEQGVVHRFLFTPDQLGIVRDGER